ncbi:MAG: ABC transporter permease [Tannerella sp.]|jgi:hypothetical protein|nr:ABC transporter permease [Tannerella sp.]
MMKLFKIAIRSLLHYKLYSLINILGLTLSLTCVIIIFRYVYSELTVDRFNKNLDRIFITTVEDGMRPDHLRFGGISNPNKEPAFVDLSKNPAVEKHSIFFNMRDKGKLQIDDRDYMANLLVADTCFMQILDFPVITGQKNLSRPEDAFISEVFARKVFGDENPVGRKLHYPDVNKELTVVGVIGKPATQSIISFDVMLSYDLQRFWIIMPQSLIMLYPSVDYRQFNQQYADYMEMASWQGKIRYQLYPCKDIYFENRIQDYAGFKHGKYVHVFVLSAVGILLLLIGIVNYINIHTVVILRRNKEYGMKKVFGAEGSKVFFQLFLENLCLIIVSLGSAFCLAGLLNPTAEKIFGIEQFFNGRFDGLLTVLLGLLLPTVTTIAPFLRYNYSSPVTSLRAVSRGGKSLFMRQFFLTFQYFITLTMITVSLFFVKQLHFMLNQDLGYRTTNIIQASFFASDNHMAAISLSAEELQARYEEHKRRADELKQKMDASTLFEHWTFGIFPCIPGGYTFDFRKPGGELQPALLMGTDETWLRLFEIQLLQGRLWNNESDHLYNYIGIVSESLLRQFEITDYETAELEPYRRIWMSSDRKEEMSKNPPYRIAGVVKDFYTAHLSQKQPPVFFYFNNADQRFPLIASFRPERRKEVIEFLHKLHDELIGGEFTYTFIEDEIAAIYREDRKIAVIYSLFTGIAILISILGLFGISLFDIRQRRKEIAIRKVNGALTADIARLLLKRYFVLLGIAFAVSLPVAGFAIQKYLENFAFRSPVSWWLFVVSGILTTAVSLLTLVRQINKACNENPAEVIKTE